MNVDMSKIGLIIFLFFITGYQKSVKGEPMNKELKLPVPELKGGISIEETLAKRRSRREYKEIKKLLKLKEEPLYLMPVGKRTR